MDKDQEETDCGLGGGVGYIPGIGNRGPFFGGLLVGAYNFGKLVYVGRVGSGFSEKELNAITRSFKPTSKSLFLNLPSTPSVA